MEKDKEVPLILERPFLATEDAWIGVKDKIIMLQINGEKVVFDVNHAMKFSQEIYECKRMDVIEQCMQEVLEKPEELN